MTKYFRYLLRQYFLNPYFIFWAIIFIYFWIWMCAWVFSRGVPEEFMLEVVGSDYGQLLIIGLGSASISAAYTFYYSSFAVRFVTKFSRLSPARFVVENFLATVAFLTAYTGLVWLLMVLTFYARYGEWYLPRNPAGLVGVSVLSAVFLYFFAMVLVYLVIFLRVPRLAEFVSYIPLMLSFVAYAAFWLDFGVAAYIIPFNLISNLCYYCYTGEKPFMGDIIGNIGRLIEGKEVSYADPALSVISLIAWTAACAAVAYVLVRKSRGVSYEEIRVL